MKCRICGANLAKENADICVDCYRKLQEEEELKKDTNEQYMVKSDFAIGYEIVKRIEIIFILLVACLGCIALQNYIESLFCLIILSVILILLIFNDKLKSKNNRIVFYERKLVHYVKNIFITDEKTIKYTDVTDVTYYQSFRQKIFGRGDLCVYVKGALPGGSLLGGAQIKDVKNIKNVYEDLTQIFEIKRK